MFDNKFIYIHDEKRSKEYEIARFCINAGADEIKRSWNVKYRVGVADQNMGMPRDFQGAKKRAKQLLVDRPSGITVVMERLDNQEDPVDRTRFRKLTVKPPVAATPGVEGIDRIVGWVNQQVREHRFTGVRYAGICVCKPDSDHRDCAAVDIFAPWDVMEKIEREFWRDPQFYHSKYSILGRTITFYNHSEPYNGTYHAHNHLSVTGGIPGSAC